MPCKRAGEVLKLAVLVDISRRSRVVGYLQRMSS